MEVAPVVTTSPPQVYVGIYSWPWLRFWLFYLVAIGVLTHLAAVWLGCRRLVHLIQGCYSPRSTTRAMDKAEKTRKAAEDDPGEDHQPEGEDLWVEPWDMDGDNEDIYPYNLLEWTPERGTRRRHPQSSPSEPAPWRSLVNHFSPRGTRATEGTSSAPSTELDTPGTPSPPLRERVMASRDMMWLVTRRLNSKDSWQL